MKAFFSIVKFLSVCMMACLVVFVSCQEELDLDDDSNNNGGNNEGNNNFTAEQLSEFLVLNNAAKISQKLSNAPDGNLRISVKDTIFVVKGLSFGARVTIKHDGMQDIRGFYVGVSDGSFYYDAPVVEAEGRDSTETIYINLELPAGIEYPLTVPIKIQPHGPDGHPLDEFIRWITIEDPEDEDVCDPTVTKVCEDRDGQTVCNSPWTWFWEFTLMEDYSGDIKTAYAPMMFIDQNAFQHGGCCWNGISIPAKYDPYCVPGNPEYFEITVDGAYYVRYFEAIDLWDDGEYERFMLHGTKTYVPDSSDYCNKIAGYNVKDVFAYYTGEHDFSPGADNLRLMNTISSNGNSGWMLNGGELLYTCHSLILTFGVEEKWTVVYRRLSENFDLENYLPNNYK